MLLSATSHTWHECCHFPCGRVAWQVDMIPDWELMQIGSTPRQQVDQGASACEIGALSPVPARTPFWIYALLAVGLLTNVAWIIGLTWMTVRLIV